MDTIIEALKADSEVLIAALCVIGFFVLVKFFTNFVIKAGMTITVLFTVYFFTFMNEDSKDRVRLYVSDYETNIGNINMDTMKDYFNSLNIQKSLQNVKEQDVSLNQRLESILQDKNVNQSEIDELFKIKELNNEKIRDLEKTLEPLRKLLLPKEKQE